MVRGTPVAADDDPFDDVVAVGLDSGWHCTGIVVSRRAVLTARHCLPASRILVGPEVGHPLVVRKVVRASPNRRSTQDAAMLFLDRDVPIRPRERRRDTRTAAPAGLVRLVGFGTTEPTGQRGFGEKRMADVLAAGWGCDGNRPLRLGCVRGEEMVVLATGGRDTCNGDSGGPLLERATRGWRLVGLTSRAATGGNSACGRGGIYLRVDGLAAWLDEQLASEEP